MLKWCWNTSIFTLQHTSSHISGILQAPTAAAPVFPPLDCCKVCPLRPDHPRSSLSQKKIGISWTGACDIQIMHDWHMFRLCSESHGWHMLALTDLSSDRSGAGPGHQEIEI